MTTDHIGQQCQQLEAMLQAAGILAHHEWQDYINYPLDKEGRESLTFGTINMEWECQHHEEFGAYTNRNPDRLPIETMPLTATTEEVFAWIKRCIEHWNKAQ